MKRKSQEKLVDTPLIYYQIPQPLTSENNSTQNLLSNKTNCTLIDLTAQQQKDKKEIVYNNLKTFLQNQRKGQTYVSPDP